MIPDSTDCYNKELYVCKWYMHEDCKETCAYAKDIRGLGCGAMMIPPGKLEREIDEDGRIV